MQTSGKEYKEYAERHVPRSRSWRNMLRAFFVGGLICCLGQLIADGYAAFGLDAELAATATSVTLVFLGALMTGLGIYDKLAKFAGAGSLVPITGFANAVAAPALEFKSEGLILGTAAKLFTIAGPVIVWGTAASVVYGVVLLIAGA